MCNAGGYVLWQLGQSVVRMDNNPAGYGPSLVNGPV